MVASAGTKPTAPSARITKLYNTFSCTFLIWLIGTSFVPLDKVPQTQASCIGFCNNSMLSCRVYKIPELLYLSNVVRAEATFKKILPPNKMQQTVNIPKTF